MDAQAVSNATAKNGLVGLAISGGLSRQGTGTPEQNKPPIILTSEERIELESLARSTKTEYRARVKARIVLIAADGAATRGIAREVGCAICIDPRLLAESGRDMILDPRRKIAQRRLVPSRRRAAHRYRRLHQRLQ